MAPSRRWRRFQSTLPVRGATRPIWLSCTHLCKFQSTLPVRGATGLDLDIAVPLLEISIHAPREGSDDGSTPRRFIADTISIHAPREGSDGFHTNKEDVALLFQSTLPVRGATASSGDWEPYPSRFQSTLPVRGATPPYRRPQRIPSISIHAPREGSDESDSWEYVPKMIISIHAPREGSDWPRRYPQCSKRWKNFNPRSP